MQPMTKKELFQCWVALVLTAGEFTVALFLVFTEGHWFAAYLAITYAMRETNGGKHYHMIVVDLVHRALNLRSK